VTLQQELSPIIRELLDQVIKAGKEVGDKMWQLPMFEEYKEQNKSDVADIKNTGVEKQARSRRLGLSGVCRENTMGTSGYRRHYSTG